MQSPSTTTLLSASLLYIAAMLLSGCIQDIDQSVDCRDICTRYEECTTEAYDVEACEDRCNDYVDTEDSNAADACDACVDGNSCVSGAFNCAAECAGILP